MDEAGIVGNAMPLKATRAAVLGVEQFLYMLRR